MTAFGNRQAYDNFKLFGPNRKAVLFALFLGSKLRFGLRKRTAELGASAGTKHRTGIICNKPRLVKLLQTPQHLLLVLQSKQAGAHQFIKHLPVYRAVYTAHHNLLQNTHPHPK